MSAGSDTARRAEDDAKLRAESDAKLRAENGAKLRDEVDKRVRRMERAERERQSLLAQSVYMGTIAGLFVVPLIVGAYLGSWLDGLAKGYSVRWTVGMLVLGVVVGSVNVYLFIRERQ